MENIRAILIDVDNTLLDFDACAEISIKNAAKDLGVNVPDDIFSIFKRTNDAFWLKMENKKLSINDIYALRWNQIFNEIGISFDGLIFESVFQKYLKRVSVAEKEAYELLQYLSCRYKIFAATNGPYMEQAKRLYDADMYYMIERIFASGDIGLSKPSREFFDYCMDSIKAFDITRNQVIMIGDSLSADVKGANEYGIHSLWYNKYGAKYEENVADFVVNNLCEIKKYL